VVRILNKLSSLLLSCIALGLTGAPATGLAAALNLTIGNYAVVGATKVNSSTVQYR